jgi:hypothetical protein
MSSDYSEISATISAVVGMFLFAGGALFAALFWAQMHRIEALGLLGQAFYDDRYQTAIDYFPFAVGASAFGLSLLIIGAVESLEATLKDLSEQ